MTLIETYIGNGKLYLNLLHGWFTMTIKTMYSGNLYIKLPRWLLTIL
jgi:hypothetical protein